MDKEDKVFRKRFFAFLKENNAYDKWLYNLRKRHPSNDIKWWDNYVEELYTNGCLMSIDDAFFWDDTKEGYDFWHKLDQKWNDLRLSLT